MAMGENHVTKTGIMAEDGLLPLLALASGTDTDCVRSSIYCLGALAENEEVRARIVELGGLVLFSIKGPSQLQKLLDIFEHLRLVCVGIVGRQVVVQIQRGDKRVEETASVRESLAVVERGIVHEVILQQVGMQAL